MIWRNTSDTYGLIHITLHWVMAMMLAVLLPLGLWMTGLDYYDPWYRKGPDLHRAIGVLLGLLLVLRLVWRLLGIQPRPLTRSRRGTAVAQLAHLLLYLLPLLLVISGYLISTADGRPLDIFGCFEIPATVQGIEGQEDIAGEIHFILAMTLMGIIVFHGLAALRHHFVFGDRTLRRMFKPQSTSDNLTEE